MVAVVELKEDNDVYLVRPALYPALAEEAKPKQLYVGVTRDGNPFVWLVNMPGPDGRLDTWSQSAHAGASLAKTHWVRIKSNRDLGAYEVLQATNLKEERYIDEHGVVMWNVVNDLLADIEAEVVA